MAVHFDVRWQQGMAIFTGGSIIMDYGLEFWPEATVLKIKHLNGGFVSYEHAAFHFTRC